MNIVEILANGNTLFAEVPSKNKKVDSLVADTNALLANLYALEQETKEFLNSQVSGDRNTLIVAAKTLQNFYEGNKLLKVETLVANLQKEEQAKLAELANLKAKVLANLTLIQKDTKTDAVTSNYDLFDGDLAQCQEGHEVLILGEHGGAILENIIEQVTNEFVLESNFDSIPAGEFQYSMDTVQANVALCEEKANELFGAKPDKVAKQMAVVEKMVESAKAVVAFFSAKDMLTRLGCNPKALKAYEGALSKAYIPYKKTLEKTLKVELNDICAVEIDEEMFPASEDMTSDPMTALTEASQTELEEEMTEVSNEEFAEAANQVSEEAVATEEETENDEELKEVGSKLSSLTANLKKMKKDD